MIELNMLAKPFNPLEWFLPKKLLKCDSYPVGSCAWSSQLENKENQDALIRYPVGKLDDVLQALEDDKWLPCPIPMVLPSTLLVYQKESHKIFVTGSNTTFDKMVTATQVCKMAKLNHNKDFILAINIHISIMCGKCADPKQLELANTKILWEEPQHFGPPAPDEAVLNMDQVVGNGAGPLHLEVAGQGIVGGWLNGIVNEGNNN